VFPLVFLLSRLLFLKLSLGHDNGKVLITAFKLFHPHFDDVISFYISGLLGLYTFLVITAMSPFRCFLQIDGSYTLIPSSNLNCYDKEWYTHLFVIVLGVLQIFLIPMVLSFTLWRNRSRLNKNAFLWRFGSLTAPYKPEFYYWEIFVLFRKTALVLLIDLSNSLSSFLRVYIVILFLLIFSVIDMFVRPRIAELGILTLKSQL
jgi:hypothetical protein